MQFPQQVKVAAAFTALAGLVLAAMFVRAPRGTAQEFDDDEDNSDSQIERGFKIAPVPLNLDGKNRALVGLGSYIVNTEGCNDCHDTGPKAQFVPGHNPYFGQSPKKINQATYLGGGRDFGTISGPPSPHIISRNLTPDKTGLPEGGNTFEQFLDIMRHGTDLDHLHPNCSATVTTNCFPTNPPFPPLDGNLLQIMPWPNFQDKTRHDLRAIYEYLKAVPCVHGNYPGEPADRCG